MEKQEKKQYVKYTVRNQVTGKILGVYSDLGRAKDVVSKCPKILYITMKEIG